MDVKEISSAEILRYAFLVSHCQDVKDMDFHFLKKKRENFGKAVTISLSVPLGVLEIVDWTVWKYPKY